MTNRASLLVILENIMNKNTLTIGILTFSIGYFLFYFIDQEPIVIYGKTLNDNNQSEHAKKTTDSSPSSLPKSLDGVRFKADYTLNESGGLIPTMAIRELFDHYLSTLGEVDLDTSTNFIINELRKSLQEPALSQALSILDNYLKFKTALASLKADLQLDYNSSTSLSEQALLAQNKLIEFRAQFFNELEIEAFFSEEDVQTAFLIEQLRINQNKSLSLEEKKQLLQQASLMLPDNVRASRERSQQHSNLRQSIVDARSQGASDEDIFQIRAQQLNRKAAEELAKLDEERAKWENRIQNLSIQRNEILNSSLSDEDKKQAVNNLIQDQFNALEQKRVSAIINDGQLN
ncbi:MAG: lipase chaperone LimK [Oceanicoccus sp.]|jgi:lipase chaperone LimK